MRRLLYFLKDYRKESVLGPLFKLLEASFELLVPLVVADIIDVGIAAGDSAYVLGRGGILILLGLIGLASSITAQYFAAKAAVGCSTRMRGALFRHLNSFSYKDLDAVGTSTLITRLTSDINQVQTGVNLVLRLFLRSPFIVFGAMIMAFTMALSMDLITASGCAKIGNLASNVASAVVFLLNGKVFWALAVPAALCNALGGYCGARYAIRGGSGKIRGMIFLVLGLMFVKMLWDLLA